MTTTPKSLDQWVEGDRKIAARADSATLALMEHRWRAVNEGGFTVASYARALGVNESTVWKYVRGFALYQERQNHAGDGMNPQDALDVANMSEAKRQAVEIVAEAKGMSATRVRQNLGHEVREVRAQIERHAEASGDREAAVEEVRARVVRQEQANRQHAANMDSIRTRFSAPYFQLDKSLHKAYMSLRDSVRIAQESSLTNEEERELLLSYVPQLRALCDLAEVAINGGDLATDWDAAFGGVLNPDEGA